MNRAQRHAAVDAAAEQPAAGGVAYALTEVRVGDQVFRRNQALGPVGELRKSWPSENFRALVASRMIEVRPA